MLATRRERVAFLLGIIALNVGLGWHLHRLWRNYRTRTQWIYNPIPPKPTAAPAAPRVAPVETQSVAEIVTGNLFRPERTSESPNEKATMPDPPLLYGTMNLGTGWFALMAPGNQAAGPSKRIVPGEEIGGYKLVSIADSHVVVEWGEKKVTLDVSETARRVPRMAERTSTARPAGAPAAALSPERVITVAPVSTPSRAAEDDKKNFTPAGYNAPPGAPVNAPAGTIIGGRRKVVRETPFGEQVWWEEVGKPSPATGKENQK